MAKKSGRYSTRYRFPLKRLMLERDVSISELARRVRSPRHHVGAVAAGKVVPGWTYALLVLEALGLTVEIRAAPSRRKEAARA